MMQNEYVLGAPTPMCTYLHLPLRLAECMLLVYQWSLWEFLLNHHDKVHLQPKEHNVHVESPAAEILCDTYNGALGPMAECRPTQCLETGIETYDQNGELLWQDLKQTSDIFQSTASVAFLHLLVTFPVVWQWPAKCLATLDLLLIM